MSFQEARENAAAAAAAAGGAVGGRLWRRISLMSVASYSRQMEMAAAAGGIGDVLGNTTWGIRKVRVERR